jgi:DNA polymerase-3 subunit epsilon
MLRHLTQPQLFVIAALTVMVLTAGTVWQFSGNFGTLLRALIPGWMGIAAVFWMLWRQVAQVPAAHSQKHLQPHLLNTDFTSLNLDTRYVDSASLPLERLDYVILDIKTNGQNLKRANIVHIGAVRIIQGKLLRCDSFERKVSAGRSIATESRPFHDLTTNKVSHAQEIDKLLAEFFEYAGDAVLVGHNIALNLSLINQTAKVRNPILDTMLLSFAAFPRRYNHTLDALSELLDETVDDGHTVMGRAGLTARIFLKLLPEIERVGAATFGDAQDLCAHSATSIHNLRVS